MKRSKEEIIKDINNTQQQYDKLAMVVAKENAIEMKNESEAVTAFNKSEKKLRLLEQELANTEK